jgi:hypothetical protein
MFSIEASSVPFRAFLGALLSVIQDVSVELPSTSNLMLEDIEEHNGNNGEGSDPQHEDNNDNGSGPYRGRSSKVGTRPSLARAVKHTVLMVCTSHFLLILCHLLTYCVAAC